METGQTTDDAGQNQNPVPPEGARKPVLIGSLPMTRYGFTVHGRLANGAKIVIKGAVYAKKGLYYQAQARVLDSVLKEIPTLELDENPIGLKMRSGGRCVLPPKDLSILGRAKPQSTVPMRATAQAGYPCPR